MATSDNESCEDWALLRNAVREPVKQMIAVEVDTVARARQAIDDLLGLDRTRPHAVIEFVAGKQTPEALLERASKISHPWPVETGLLFLLDAQPPSIPQDDADTLLFWQGMNLLREKWNAFDIQLVFLLLPFNYRYLTTAADHLKRWMSLKLHLLGDSKATDAEISRELLNASPPEMYMLSPDVARQQLSTLERQLQTALQRGEPTDSLVRRYYLPMFAAAVSLGELDRALKLRAKVKGHPVAAADESNWLHLNIELDLGLFHLEQAKQKARKLLKFGEHRADKEDISVASFYLGRIAQEKRNFAEARKQYHKTRKINEQLNYQQGLATTYHQLGVVAGEEHNFAEAKIWYQKSLEIKEASGVGQNAASTYHQLGLLAQMQRDFAEARSFYQKSLDIEKKFGHVVGIAASYHQLGALAEEQLDYAEAENWYLEALKIKEKLANAHSTAATYNQLGILAGVQKRFELAGRWHLKAVQAYANTQDNEMIRGATKNFLLSYSRANSTEQTQLREMWELTGLGPFLAQADR